MARAPAVGDLAAGVAKRALALWVAALLVAKLSLRTRVDEPVGAVGDHTERRPVVAKLGADLLVSCLAIAAAERSVALGRQPHPPSVRGVGGRAIGLGANRLAGIGHVLGRPAPAATALAILGIGDEAARSRLAGGLGAQLIANCPLLAAETLGTPERGPPRLLMAPALLAGGSALGTGLGATGFAQRLGALCAERSQALAPAVLVGDERSLALKARVEAALGAAVERLARDPPARRSAVGGV